MPYPRHEAELKREALRRCLRMFRHPAEAPAILKGSWRRASPWSPRRVDRAQCLQIAMRPGLHCLWSLFEYRQCRTTTAVTKMGTPSLKTTYATCREDPPHPPNSFGFDMKIGY
ncbi:hypothetical protein SCUP515_09317 [Seiridium cupressi]